MLQIFLQQTAEKQVMEVINDSKTYLRIPKKEVGLWARYISFPVLVSRIEDISKGFLPLRKIRS